MIECPICLENKGNYYTECYHIYCLSCLIKIKRCAICRKGLIRVSLCQDIKRFLLVKQMKQIKQPIRLRTNNTNNEIIMTNMEFLWLCNVFSLF